MRTVLTTLFSAAVVVLAVGCGNPDGFSDDEWELLQTMSPLPAVPADPTNRYADNPAAAALGKKLFFETRYSGALTVGDDGQNGALGAVGEKGKVACASCHNPDKDFSDGRSKPGNVSLGTGFTSRNAPSLVNVAFYDWYGWGGKQGNLWTQASLSPESADNTGGNRCGYAHMLYAHYRVEYDGIFADPLPAALDPAAPDAARFPASCKPKKAGAADGAWELMEEPDREAVNWIMANQGKAVAAYERKLVSGNAPFDRYVAGEKDALSAAEKRGLKLFVGKAFCVQCHAGPTFSDQKFHNLGIPQEGPNVPAEDVGRLADLKAAASHAFRPDGKYSDDAAHGARMYEGHPFDAEEDLGRFRTKGLRNVALTAPYFHTGGYANLAEVVDYYDQGGTAHGFVGERDVKMKALNLTAGEKADLVAFLGALTGEALPAELTQKP